MEHARKSFSLNHLQSAFWGIFCSAVYFVAVTLVLRDYAAVEWEIYRIYFGRIDSYDVLAVMVFLTISGTIVPRHISTPSSLFAIISYIFIVIPAAVCLVAMDGATPANRYLTLLFMLIGFYIIASVSTSAPDSADEGREPAAWLAPLLLILAVLLMIFLYLRFGSIMSFASLDTLYEQREKGAANNFIEGYAQTYSQYVFSTGLFAFGLYKKNIVYIAVGLAGSVMNFAITAEKAGAMYPVFISFLFFALLSKRKFLVSSNFLMISLSALLVFSIYTRAELPTSDFVSWYLGTRTILTPGIFITHYTDFFFDRGYTYFSHLRGLNFFVTVPIQYVNDVRWPSIGLIVGEDFIGFPKLNANANFVASDGIASLGLFGIIVAFVILAVIMRVFDKVGQGVPKPLLLSLLLPIALSLANGSALSVLTSTGGFFWIALLAYAFKRRQVE